MLKCLYLLSFTPFCNSHNHDRHNNDDTDTYSEEPELPSGQKGSPSTGEKNNSLPFSVTLVLSGAGIIFFGGRAYLISRTKKTDI